MENARKALGSENITYCDSMYEAVHGVDALLIFTEWEAFKNPDFDRMKKMMRNNAIFDGRNLFDVAQMEALGFYYASIGRRTASRIKMQPLRS
jgi:UDPglucose 6-dehydrogenase